MRKQGQLDLLYDCRNLTYLEIRHSRIDPPPIDISRFPSLKYFCGSVDYSTFQYLFTHIPFSLLFIPDCYNIPLSIYFMIEALVEVIPLLPHLEALGTPLHEEGHAAINTILSSPKYDTISTLYFSSANAFYNLECMNSKEDKQTTITDDRKRNLRTLFLADFSGWFQELTVGFRSDIFEGMDKEEGLQQ